MAFFEWTAELSVGIAAIDEDHKGLIELVEALHQVHGDDSDDVTIGALIGQLLARTSAHFQREEAEMQRIAFAGLSEHRNQHRQLLRELTRLDQAYREGHSAWSRNTTQFLRDWLAYHVMRSDVMMAEAIQAFRASRHAA